jgi:Domain of unknown function (DUF4404)
MSDQPESKVSSAQAVQTQIHDVAQILRGSQTVSRDVQIALAELLDELSTAIKATSVPPAEVVHLAKSAAQLAQTLHDQQDEGLVAKARERLGTAMFQAESHAPNAVALARGVIDALASIGI